MPPTGARRDLVLTYDNSVVTDGVGAQLQRIYGMYAVSRLLGVSYLHSPIGRVDYQGLAALEENSSDPGFHHEFNDLFHIESDLPASSEFRTVRLPDVSPEVFRELVAMRDRCPAGEPPTLVRAVMPYGVADRYPDCYAACRDISPFQPAPRDGRPLRVAVHVRRGELFAVDSARMLPNAYYVMVALTVAGVLDSARFAFEIEIWTELPHREFVVRPGRHGIGRRISAPITIDPGACRLEDFDVVPNVVYRINGRAIDCIRELATADVLVMSRSSFSYLGGILNRNGIVLYHPFWHRAPSAWLTVGPDGRVDQEQLDRAVRAMASRRCAGIAEEQPPRPVDRA